MFSFISGKGQDLWKKTQLSPDFKHLWLPGSNAEIRHVEARLWGRHSLRLDLSFGVIVAEDATTKQDFIIRPDYYAQIGFFCKREMEFEKLTHIPFRFRLGSLADCNAMEGKH
jgi:hypothetical protein